MSHYNLVDEGWISVVDLTGNRKELGILETLTTAESISGIEDPSPLVTASLHRFLLAVLYRALEGPCDINDAKKLFTEGLPKEKIKSYLEKWKDRFWLFDEKYPFGQNPYVPENQVEPWTKLTAEFNATSNKVLFDHTDTTDPGEKTPAECARWLVSIMSFSVSGGKGYYPSPSPNAVMCIPQGINLSDTLIYMLVPQNRAVLKNDLPSWEKEPAHLPLTNVKRAAAGFADYYTWQARMVLLNQSPSGNVSSVRFIAGEGFDKDCGIKDPMQAHRKDDRRGLLPVIFKEYGFWREFQSLLPDGSEPAPKVVENAVGLTRQSQDRIPKSFLVLGLKNTPPSANLDFWRMERFEYPPALAGDRCIRVDIQRILEDAEDAGKSLYSACARYGQSLLSRGERKVEKKDVQNYIEQMLILPHFWSTLEAKFHEVLRDYTIEKEPYDIRHDWLVAVRNALTDAWKLHQQSISGSDAWAIRALVNAEKLVAIKIKEINSDIQQLEKAT